MMYQVLLVDDDSPTRKVGKAMLEHCGCRVEVVGHGRDAVTAVSQRRFDLILMDCLMPVMDGYEATDAIRKMETENRGGAQAGHIPIVAITGYATEEERRRCLSTGMDDYLCKPFSIPDLKLVLERWLFCRPAPSFGGDSPQGMAGAAALPEDVPPIDQKALDVIAALQPEGADSILRKVISLYLDSSRKLMQSIRESAEMKDAQALHHAAHTLKSSSAYLGAMTLSGMCKELETMGRANAMEGTDTRIAALDREYRRVYASLEKLMESTSTGDADGQVSTKYRSQ